MSILTASALLPFATSSNETDTPPPDYVGYIATGIAVVFYGSNYVPVKKFDTGDGMLFQFFLCLGIWCVGMAVNAIRAFPVFQPIVMLGGAIWTVGNLFAVPIIQCIGMGLGILIWGTFNMLTGWATGRFGLLGIPPQVPTSLAFNYAGVGLCAIGTVLFFFVKPEMEVMQQLQRQLIPGGSPIGRTENEGGPAATLDVPRVARSHSDQEGSISVYEDVFGSQEEAAGGQLYPSLNSRRSDDKMPIVTEAAASSVEGGWSGMERREEPMPFWMRLSTGRRRAFGIIMSVLIGPMFGVGFVPTYYVQSHVTGASTNGLDYVFSHFTGILCTSTLCLLAYAAVTGNRPGVNPRLLLPATVSGLMWGVAGASWFLANQVLSESISYPIISSAPAIVAALWSVCVFREIRGMRNLVLLSIAITVSAAGSILNGLSKS